MAGKAAEQDTAAEPPGQGQGGGEAEGKPLHCRSSTHLASIERARRTSPFHAAWRRRRWASWSGRYFAGIPLSPRLHPRSGAQRFVAALERLRFKPDVALMGGDEPPSLSVSLSPSLSPSLPPPVTQVLRVTGIRHDQAR